MSRINSLEEKLKVLHLATKQKLSEVEPEILERHKTLLVTYEIEKENRPQLVQNLTHRRMLLEYLMLPAEEKDKLQAFTERHPQWYVNDCRIKGPEESLNILRKQRIIKRTIDLFHHFKENRKHFQLFYSSIQSGGEGNLLSSLGRIYFGGRDSLLYIASEECPEILEYISANREEVFKKDTIEVMLDIFDNIFMKERRRYDVFNFNFLRSSYKKRKFGGGHYAYNKIRYIFLRESKMNVWDNIFDWLVEVRPDIAPYRDIRSVFRHEAPEETYEIFQKFLRKIRLGECFNCGNLIKYGGNVFYRRAHNFLEGGWRELLKQTSKLHPEMLPYIDYESVKKNDREAKREPLLIKFTECLEAFLKEENKFLNTCSLISTREGRRLYGQIKYYFDGGIQEAAQLVFKERPELREYWSYTPMRGYPPRSKNYR